jgi:hypothetical protein
MTKMLMRQLYLKIVDGFVQLQYFTICSCLFLPPAVDSENFVREILSMSEFSGLIKLLQLYDYVSNNLNEMFAYKIPVIGLPAASFELKDNPKYRDKFLALLK